MADHPLTPGAPGFYVYHLLVDGVLRYIGKGCGERAKEHHRTATRINRIRAGGRKVKTSRFYNRLAKAVAGGAEVSIEIAGVWHDEQEAKRQERASIAGAPKDQLWNTFAGGDGFDSEFIKALWRDPGYRNRMSAASKARWNDPEYRANQAAVRADPDHQARMSKALTKALADPTVRKKMSDRKREALKDPTYRQRLAEAAVAGRTPEKRRRDSERLKALWADPEWRSAQIEKYRARFADPEKLAEHARRKAAEMTPERRRRTSEQQKRLWSDPAHKAAQLAARVAAKTRKG